MKENKLMDTSLTIRVFLASIGCLCRASVVLSLAHKLKEKNGERKMDEVNIEQNSECDNIYLLFIFLRR